MFDQLSAEYAPKDDELKLLIENSMMVKHSGTRTIMFRLLKEFRDNRDDMEKFVKEKECD